VDVVAVPNHSTLFKSKKNGSAHRDSAKKTKQRRPKMSKCKVCGRETNAIVNINLKAVLVCQPCCDAITLQNVAWLIEHQEKEAEDE
jgi:transcription elongation factor Elf1